jgi:hypothetical protein
VAVEIDEAHRKGGVAQVLFGVQCRRRGQVRDVIARRDRACY